MVDGFTKKGTKAISLYAVTADGLAALLKKLTPREAAFVASAGFSAGAESLLLLPEESGRLGGAILGLGTGGDPLTLAAFSEKLPAGTYKYVSLPDEIDPALAALAWGLGLYRFKLTGAKSVRQKAKATPVLIWPEGVNEARIEAQLRAVYFARDLINTPANLMGPAELAAAAQKLAKGHGAKFSQIIGPALLKANYPLVHAVGMGSDRAPRLVDIRWGRSGAPKLTLVGKGVCFDTGGYDIKPSSSMLTMKKDMGGSAVVLALADLIMTAKLDVNLRVLVGAVENSVSGKAYRPSDVFPSRKGLTVEIGNTDAEGRLVLADLLTEADSETPDLLLDIATLTGAARVATGMEVPPFFTDDEQLAAELMEAAAASFDPLWRLPLWRGYETTLDSKVADLTNTPHYGYAGAITAGLFLNRFVEKAAVWAHFDIAGWNDRPKPGRRVGAEATALRALFAMLESRFGTQKTTGKARTRRKA